MLYYYLLHNIMIYKLKTKGRNAMKDFLEICESVKRLISPEVFNYYLEMYEDFGRPEGFDEYMPSYIEGVSSKLVIEALKYESEYDEYLRNSELGEVECDEMNSFDIIEKIRMCGDEIIEYRFVKWGNCTALYVYFESENGTVIFTMKFIVKDKNDEHAFSILKYFLKDFKEQYKKDI